MITKMISNEAYSELLAALYAASLDDAQWPAFLTQLCEITGSIIVFYMANDSALGNRMLSSGGLPVREDTVETYRSTYSYTDPFREAFMRSPRTGIIEGEDLVPHKDWHATDYYKARGSLFGLEHMTCVVISISPRTQHIISLWRGAGRPYLEPEHMELLRMMLPHLQNAIHIHNALGRAEERAATAEAALDASPTGTILLDRAGRIVHMNHAAQQMAVAADALRVNINRIVPVDPSQRSAFDALVADAADALAADADAALNISTNTLQADTRPNHIGGSLTLARRGGKGPLQILVTPLRLNGTSRATVRVLVLVTDPEREVSFPDTVLRELYGLTTAETEIANGLLTGFSVEEIAQLRRVSVATVRSQLKPLLGKTGTRRQADLVRVLSTLPRTSQA